MLLTVAPAARASLTVLLAVAVASCGSDADPVEQAVEPMVTMAEQGLEAIDEAGGLACDAERRTLEQAVEAYTLLEGRPPADEGELVPDFLRAESELFDVTDGTVVPTTACA